MNIGLSATRGPDVGNRLSDHLTALRGTMTLVGVILETQCLFVFSTGEQIPWLRVFDQATKSNIVNNREF